MESYRVLVSDPISEAGINLLAQEAGIQVDVKTNLSKEALKEIIPNYQGLIVRSQTEVTSEILEAATELKAVGRAGVGVDNIHREAASQQGVIVMNTPAGNTISTAELAFTLMLSTARNISLAHQSVIKGRFKEGRKSYKGIELYKKNLAVVGMGRIGTEFAKRAQAFGMNVTAYDPFLTQARAEALNVRLAKTPEEALNGADVVTLHVPLTAETHHFLNAKRLQLMNPGALVINCARGGLIDEHALKEAMRRGHIAGCGLDVFEEEPPPADEELFLFEKHITFTPHLGASTKEAQENVGIQIAEQMRDFLMTGEIRNAVNMPSLDAETLKELGPYLRLSEALGRLLSCLGPSNPDSIRVSYHGEIASKDTESVSRQALYAYLSGSRPDGQVNLVNAPSVAAQMGLETVESTIHAVTEFNELIVVELRKGAEKFRIAGTIIGKTPRIVEVDRLFIDVSIKGQLVFLRNDDRPGIVGVVGTLLGEANVNIANMSLAQNKKKGNALTVLELDQPLPSTVKNALKNTEGILQVIEAEL